MDSRCRIHEGKIRKIQSPQSHQEICARSGVDPGALRPSRAAEAETWTIALTPGKPRSSVEVFQAPGGVHRCPNAEDPLASVW